MIAIGAFAIGSRRSRACAVTASVATSVLLVPLGATAYAWLGAMALLVFALAVGERADQRGPLVVAGALAGLSVALRPDLLLPALAVPVVVGLARRSGLRSLVSGFCLGLVPTVVALVAAGPGMLTDVYVDRLGVAARASRLPVPPHLGDDRVLFAAVLAAAAVCLGTAAIRRARSALANGAAVLALAALAQALQRADWTHLLMALSVLCPLALVLLVELMGVTRSHRSYALLALGCTVVAIAVVGAPHRVLRPIVDSAGGDAGEVVQLHHDGRVLPLRPLRATYLAGVLRDVDRVAGPQSVLFAGPLDWRHPSVTDLSSYYLLPGVRQRARQMEITPVITTASGSGLMTDLRTADILVLVDNGDRSHNLFPYAGPEPPRTNDYIAEHFCVLSTHGYYRVLVPVADGEQLNAVLHPVSPRTAPTPSGRQPTADLGRPASCAAGGQQATS